MVKWVLGVTRKNKTRNEYVRDCENRKARRQTSDCKTTMVWAREKERRKLRGKKDDGEGERRLGKGWS